LLDTSATLTSVKPAAFDYFAPESLTEALALLRDVEGAKVLAGGQSLVPAMNFRLTRPVALIDINRVPGLEGVSTDDGEAQIGALTRHRAFEQHVVPGPLGRLMVDMAHHVGHLPIRARGTFGGSLAHADPAAEWCLLARTLDATMITRSSEQERRIPASEFFSTMFTTALDDGDLLTEVRLPLLGAGHLVGFSEFSRRVGDFALVMIAVVVEVHEGTVTTARIGAGGISDVPLRLSSAEAALNGGSWGPSLWAEAAEAGRAEVEPFEDIHGSAEYRRDLVGALIQRACQQATG
jgi:carbon-monoxide dehydrogenase medium subunit